MYAIVEIAGKQYKVQEDDTLYVPRLQAAPDETVTFDRVLLVAGDDYHVGTPTVSGATVTAKVLAHVKGDKIIVFKKKRRKRFKVKNGHRQPFTQVQIASLSTNGNGQRRTSEAEAPQDQPRTSEADVQPEAPQPAPAEAPSTQEETTETAATS